MITYVRRLRARDPQEQGRAATPLELLTDLCYVVAIAQAATQLHHATTEGHLASALLPFGMVFFAIWWAWLNFTWFSSAYDNDDVIHRLLTILQILGSLVLAAGVEDVFAGDLTLVVIGYVIMRVGLLAQWLRAAHDDPTHRATTLRYALGIALVQVAWVGSLFVPREAALWAFLILIIAEFSVPILAERHQPTTWHAHHVAERYSLLFVIVLGETILSTTVAIQQGLSGDRLVPAIGLVVAGGVLIVFSLWWLYFGRSGGEALECAHGEPAGEYVWGFGHYFIFAAGAAIGAGLAARVGYWTGEGENIGTASGLLVTVPVAILLVAIWLLLVRQHDDTVRTWLPFALATVATLASNLTPYPELITGVVCAALVAVDLLLRPDVSRR
ncbi:MAG: low temperature requirement protein A [Propionibacteriales bacterium]|nr:low temperature requirement protein A [Propionibacteriales bacterium]